MKHNRTKVLLSAAVIATLFTACKSKPDTDTPFPKTVSPSVFMASQNQFVYALDPVTGLKKWECFIGSAIKSSPVLYHGTLFVGNSSSILFKIDPNTGVKNQSKVGFGAGITATPVGKDNFLFIASGNNIKSLDIQPDTIKWSFTAGGSISSSPTVADTQLVFGCDDGFIYMLDNRNGKLIWKSANYSTKFQSSAAMDSTSIYIGADDFNMYSFKRKDGTLTWNYTTGAPVTSSPLVYGGNVIFGSDDKSLYNLENISGQPRWVTTTKDRIRSSPYLYGQTIYVGSYDQSLYAVNSLDGSVKWAFPTKGLIASSPVVYKDYVYFGSYDRNFYALDIASGLVVWQYVINGLMDCSPSIDPNNSDGNGINATISGASKD